MKANPSQHRRRPANVASGATPTAQAQSLHAAGRAPPGSPQPPGAGEGSAAPRRSSPGARSPLPCRGRRCTPRREPQKRGRGGRARGQPPGRPRRPQSCLPAPHGRVAQPPPPHAPGPLRPRRGPAARRAPYLAGFGQRCRFPLTGRGPGRGNGPPAGPGPQTPVGAAARPGPPAHRPSRPAGPHSLDVLGAPGALDGFGSPALLLLGDVVLQSEPQPSAVGGARPPPPRKNGALPPAPGAALPEDGARRSSAGPGRAPSEPGRPGPSEETRTAPGRGREAGGGQGPAGTAGARAPHPDRPRPAGPGARGRRARGDRARGCGEPRPSSSGSS